MNTAPSYIAERIRRRVADLGMSLRAASLAAGWSGAQLSVLLGRMDAGGNLRADSLAELARALRVSAHWLLTGEDPPQVGTKVAEIPGWTEAERLARERHRIPPEVLAEVGAWIVPRPPAQIDAPFVVALARALIDARA